MNALARARALRTRALVVAGLYALLVMSAPVLHHDFLCHQKSPTHCVACTASPSAPRAVATVVVAPALAEVGRVAEAERTSFHARNILSLPGRAPPA
jgi:hypothetical protein